MFENPVRISEQSGKWIVRVTRNGSVSERMFDFELHAMSWASEQLMKSGLPTFIDDEAPELAKG